MKVCCRAPGKVIWFGEHFVVLGKPAIASAIDLYARVCISSSQHTIIESRDKNLVYRYSRDKEPPKTLKPFKQIVDYVLDSNIVEKLRSFHAVIESDIPIAAGLGSSAATSVAFTAALLKYHGLEPSHKLVSRIAFEAERIVHKKPSGIDNTIATYGGFIYYRGGFMKRVDVDWREDYTLLIVDTGRERSTGFVVKKVLDRYSKWESVMEKIYGVAEEITSRALELLVKGDLEGIGELMNICHGLLVSLGISTYEIESIVHTALDSGAIGAKITGAGLGGSVMVLAKRGCVDDLVKKLSLLSPRIILVKPVSKGFIIEEK